MLDPKRRPSLNGTACRCWLRCTGMIRPAIVTAAFDDKNVMNLITPAYASRRLAARCNSMIAAAFISCAIAIPPVYGSTWLKAKTSNFTIYSTYTRDRTHRLATLVEEARSFVVKAIATPDVSLVRDVVFVASRDEYRRLTGSDTTVGTYVTDSSGRGYLIFTWLGAESSESLIHELARSALIKMYPGLPWCLTQGIADVIATTRWHKNAVRYGGENISLATAAWVDDDDSIKLRDLLQVDDSVLNTVNYATFRTVAGESWMFAHMLMMSEAYSEQFPIFLEHVQEGSSVSNSLTTAYRKSMDQIEVDFRRYVNATGYRSVTLRRTTPDNRQLFTADIMAASDVYALAKRLHSSAINNLQVASRDMSITANEIADSSANGSSAAVYQIGSDKTLRIR